MFCKHKDILGEPDVGFHKHFLNIAVFDVIATIIISYIIHRLFKISFVKVTIILFIIGILAHRMFCVKTTIDKFLFGRA